VAIVAASVSIDRQFHSHTRLTSFLRLQVLALIKPGYCWLDRQNTSIQVSWRDCESSALIGYEICRRQEVLNAAANHRVGPLSPPVELRDDLFL